MDAPAVDVPTDRPAEAGASTGSPMEALRALWKDVPGLLNDRIELLSLELQRAGVALAQVVVLIVVATILGVTAWLVLWGAITLALVAAGLPLILALAATFGVNLATAAWAVARARRLLPLLRLPATRRHLLVGPSPGTHDVAAAVARDG